MFQYGIGFKSTSQRTYIRRKAKSREFIIDETLLKVSNQFVWVWIAIIDELTRVILGIHTHFPWENHSNCRTISKLLANKKEYGKHPVSTDGGTWYPYACGFLKLNHHIHSPYEKSIIERTIQYLKDRTESFDDYFPCRKSKCKLEHIMHYWFNLFVDMHYQMFNEKIKWTEPWDNKKSICKCSLRKAIGWEEVTVY